MDGRNQNLLSATQVEGDSVAKTFQILFPIDKDDLGFPFGISFA